MASLSPYNNFNSYRLLKHISGLINEWFFSERSFLLLLANLISNQTQNKSVQNNFVLLKKRR